MRDDEPPDPRDVARRDPDGVHAEAWTATLEDMEAIAEDRRDDGWESHTVVAAHTDTKSRDVGDDDQFGLVHVVPNNHADPFEETYDPETFTEYLAYGTSIETVMYVVTELLDPYKRCSILVASSYNVGMARGMVESAEQAGYLPTHYKTIDGTLLGTFVHETYGPLITRPE